MSWSFKQQLQVGDRGQELFLKYYHEPLVVYPKHAADFQLVKCGGLVELKTDTYNMEKTANFFWERWSDMDKKKPGGPWQSHKHKVKRFVYMFVRHNVYYEFQDVPALVARLDELIASKKYKPFPVKNRGWITVGYPIPRTELADLYIEIDFTEQYNREDLKEKQDSADT